MIMKAKFKLNSIRKVLVLFLCSTFLLSCNDDNPVNNDQSAIKSVESKMSNGVWRISNFYDFDHDNDITIYEGYHFTFGANNVVTATIGLETYTGSWSVTSRNPGNPSLSKLGFNITFSDPNLTVNFNNDWNIESNSVLELNLSRISRKKGGTDYLTISKNMKK